MSYAISYSVSIIVKIDYFRFRDTKHIGIRREII